MRLFEYKSVIFENARIKCTRRNLFVLTKTFRPILRVTPPHGALRLTAFSPSLRLILRAPNYYIKPQIHPLPMSRMFSAIWGRSQKAWFLLAQVNYFKIITCVSANRNLRNKPPICASSASGGKGECAAFYNMRAPKCGAEEKPNAEPPLFKAAANVGFFLKITEFL